MIRDQDRKSEAVILGNGSSLRGFAFERLVQFDSFGMNAAYRYWYDIGWFPHYYSCLDFIVGESHSNAIAELIKKSDQFGIRGFLLRKALLDKLGKEAASPKVFNFDLLRHGFECWIPGPVTTGSHTCAWASILGYKNIYLLGIDCNYVEIVPNAEKIDGSVLEIITDANNPNYFFDSYQIKGDKFNIPNPRKDLHLKSWRKIGPKVMKKSRIFNTNFASRVDQFPYINFDDIEKGGRVPVFFPSEVLSGSSLDEPNYYVFLPSRKTAESNIELRSPLVKAETPQYNFFCKKEGSIISYEVAWKSANKTEELAFSQAVNHLPKVMETLYFGFPWSTLIDLIKK